MSSPFNARYEQVFSLFSGVQKADDDHEITIVMIRTMMLLVITMKITMFIMTEIMTIKIKLALFE